MSRPNDGGPAFPLASKGWIGKSVEDLKPTEIVRHGMSLRAYLAGKAMQGLVAGITRLHPSHENIIENRPQDVSELAVLYADTLLAELGKLEGKMEVRKVDLREADEPAPKFKVNDRVRVRTDVGVFEGKVGDVEAVFPDTFSEGFKYRVHVTDGMRETYYERHLEAAEEGE